MKPLYVLIAIIITCVACEFLLAATCSGAFLPPVHKTLHVGNSGRRVKDLQWLMSGHDPSAYRSVKTYHGKIDGRYGKTTANAVWNMKYRLGYPLKYVNKDAGAELFSILKGYERRPIQWIAVAAKRQSEIKHSTYRSQITACQRHVVSIAQSQIGRIEIPWGSNDGPSVRMYQYVTGAYRAPWCASFAQWVITRAGHGPIANRSAGVFYIRGWAYAHGELRSKPEPGTLVLYLWSTGHMGVVVKVTQAGFYAVEGNYHNQVAEVYHTFSRSAIAFVYLPHCS